MRREGTASSSCRALLMIRSSMCLRSCRYSGESLLNVFISTSMTTGTDVPLWCCSHINHYAIPVKLFFHIHGKKSPYPATIGLDKFDNPFDNFLRISKPLVELTAVLLIYADDFLIPSSNSLSEITSIALECYLDHLVFCVGRLGGISTRAEVLFDGGWYLWSATWETN